MLKLSRCQPEPTTVCNFENFSTSFSEWKMYWKIPSFHTWINLSYIKAYCNYIFERSRQWQTFVLRNEKENINSAVCVYFFLVFFKSGSSSSLQSSHIKSLSDTQGLPSDALMFLLILLNIVQLYDKTRLKESILSG